MFLAFGSTVGILNASCLVIVKVIRLVLVQDPVFFANGPKSRDR
jgi:hypothetical protein